MSGLDKIEASSFMNRFLQNTPCGQKKSGCHLWGTQPQDSNRDEKHGLARVAEEHPKSARNIDFKADKRRLNAGLNRNARNRAGTNAIFPGSQESCGESRLSAHFLDEYDSPNCIVARGSRVIQLRRPQFRKPQNSILSANWISRWPSRTSAWTCGLIGCSMNGPMLLIGGMGGVVEG
jgi:hypothetical protein